jgi:hypothetical protein
MRNKNFRHKLECNRPNMKQRCRREDDTKTDLKYRTWERRLDSKDSVLGPLAGSRNEMNCRVPQKKGGGGFLIHLGDYQKQRFL